jgi:hypothetical protein
MTMKISGRSEQRGCCRKCIHFVRREGWWCSLLTIPTLQEKGYQITTDTLPSPEEFVCDEDYEPP